MKKNKFLLVFIILPLVFSCRKQLEEVKQKKIEDLLTDKNWKIEEISYVEDNNLYYYLRGGLNNTANFENNILLFNENQTGTYTDGGATFSITWQFGDTDKSKLDYTIYDYFKGDPKLGTNAEIRLENLNVTDSYLKYAEIYSHDGQNSIISSVKRILD